MNRQAYPQYKPSGVAWLGDIPEHWEMSRVKHIARFTTGWTPQTSQDEYYFGGNPWATIADLGPRLLGDPKGRISDDAIASSRMRISPKGSLLFSFKLSIGQVSIADRDLYTNEAIATFPPDNGTDVGYLYWAAPLFIPMNADENIYGAKLLGQETIKNATFAVPPANEQQAIAAFLDRETARIDTLIKKKQRQIELLQEKRSALISHAVTKGLDPNVKMKDSGIEWLGEIPEHWALPPLYARYSVELGKMLDAKRFTGNYLLPYLRNIDVQWDRVNVENLPEMDIEPDEYGRFTLADGDLLVCEGGEVGRTAMWSGELPVCAFQKAIHRVRPRSNQDLPRFFYYIMRAAAWSGVFLAYGNPNTIPHLTAEKLRVYRFPFPPHDEQEMILKHLDFESQRIDAMVAKVKRSIDKLQEFRTALISAAVTGKIDVRRENT